MSKDSLTTFFRSRLFAGIVAGVGITLIAVFIFEIGVTVGYHEATFSEHWGANYGNNFGGPSNDMGLPDAHLPQPNGTFGKIISVSAATSSGMTIVIENSAKPEQKVLITSDTSIRDHESTITAASLTVGAYAVVVGNPDDQGEIEAKLIRLVPAPAGMTNTATDTGPVPQQ